MQVRNAVLKQLGRRALQPFWERLFRVWVIGQNFCSSTVAESGELNVLDWIAARIEKGATLLHVGANQGQYALVAASRLNPGRLYSFEPSHATFALPKQAVTTARLEQIIFPEKFALSDKPGGAILRSSHAGSPTAALHDLRNPITKFRDEFSEREERQTLDGVCEARVIVDIALLKIDVEGHELAVLRGAQRLLDQRRIRHIQFEFGEANLDFRTYSRSFHDLLSRDFDFYRIVSDGLRLLLNYHPSLEIFATMNFLAVRKA